MYNNTLTLNNGARIPQLGLGTWFIDDAKVADAVKEAVKLGYRHIDTAQAYGNERGVGEGVRNCGVSREKLFVVSKVAAEHKTYEESCKKNRYILVFMLPLNIRHTRKLRLVSMRHLKKWDLITLI